MKDKAYEIATTCKYDGCKRALSSIVYNFYNKKTGSGVTVNKQLAK